MFARKPFAKSSNPTFGVQAPAAKKNEAPVKGINAKAGITRPTRRAALGDVTNASKGLQVDDGKKKIAAQVKPRATRAKVTANPSRDSKIPQLSAKKEVSSSRKEKVELELSADVHLDNDIELPSFNEGDDVPEAERSVLSFDEETKDDIFHVGQYARDIFDYYLRRERMFQIPRYMDNRQCHISAEMRFILVDWMVEIQENFELNHETLYLAVKLMDMYLSRVDIEKDSLQLLASAAIFIASKFDERCPPLIEDFTYIADNAFDFDQFVKMEMEVLKKVDFDLGIPISYRFLRRYAKVGRQSMETLTLARYILELSLMEYDFVSELDSKMAASSLYIAMKMRQEGAWEGDIVKACGYELKDIRYLVVKLNEMLRSPPSLKGAGTIRCKYSHVVFHEVAKIAVLPTDQLL